MAPIHSDTCIFYTLEMLVTGRMNNKGGCTDAKLGMVEKNHLIVLGLSFQVE